MSNIVKHRGYGSIAHLSTSKLTQQADKKIQIGQEKILTEKLRDKNDLIIVTEKVDGSNVGIKKHNGELIPITRSGYPALTSPYIQHHVFHDYVMINKDKYSDLPEGYTICGEWCIQAHGTIYDLNNSDPFIVFDIKDDRNNRVTQGYMRYFCYKRGIKLVRELHCGEPIYIEDAYEKIKYNAFGGDKSPEGIVYRCERNGEFDFAAKWVRSDKQDGKYLDKVIYNNGLPNYILDLIKKHEEMK